MNRIRKIVTYCVIGSAVAFTSKFAAAETAEIPVAGINITLEEAYQTNDNAIVEINNLLSDITSVVHNLSFANVTDYVNIRSEAKEGSEIIGKLYRNGAATILEKEGDWYKITSGSVTGYIKSDYLVTGEEAEKLSKKVGTTMASVTATTLKVREEASLDSSVLSLVPKAEELKVIKEENEWMKVSLEGNTTGYVSSEFVEVKKEYKEAISIEEEQAQIEAEVKRTAENNSSSTNTGNNNSSSSSSLRSQIVNYALQFEGNPYVWGGTSLTNGTDCSGFTQSVLANFGIGITRTSRSQAVGGRSVSIQNIKPGDLVFYQRYGTINHVAIYIGNGQVISASSASTGIRITNLYYRQPCKVVSYID
ncbi:MAG: hypothetical protein K0S47_1812 [Herbinix sp.]|jgi:cell wall-associated NlpC family hydrolase|nr:hypothetical protein [Herbinix sp.]